MNRLDGKVALVTGGARGLGGASAKLMAAAGAKVLITDLLDEVGAGTVAEIEKAGGNAAFLHHDVVNETGWQNAVKYAVDHFGGLDILVNNAGIADAGKPIIETTLEQWRRVIAIDLDSLFLGIKYATPALGARASKWPGGGSIINISSQMGHVGAPNRTIYCASKWALEGLSKAMAAELGVHRIRVNTLGPTFIETPLARQFLANQSFREHVLSMIKLGRVGQVEDLMGAIVFLASDASALMTGSALLVDGGWTAT